MRIILDTNVLVSALIQRSYPYFIVESVLVDARVQPCISGKLFSEYLSVLNRDKFSRFPDFKGQAQTLLSAIEGRALKFEPIHSLAVIDDEADNRLLELAVACRADYLVTGNTNDFTMPEYESTKIITPKNFFELLNKHPA